MGINSISESPERVIETKRIEEFVKAHKLEGKIKDIDNFSDERRERTAEAIKVSNENPDTRNEIFAQYLLLSRNNIEKTIKDRNFEDKNLFFRNELWMLDDIIELPEERKNEAIKLMLIDGYDTETAYSRSWNKKKLDNMILEIIDEDEKKRNTKN